jgi:hypothetical protein
MTLVTPCESVNRLGRRRFIENPMTASRAGKLAASAL